MPEETVAVYHSLKPIWDADNENHHLMMLSISQLLSSKEVEQVETYHEFYARVSTRICSMAQTSVRTKSRLADSALPLLPMNSNCIIG